MEEKRGAVLALCGRYLGLDNAIEDGVVSRKQAKALFDYFFHVSQVRTVVRAIGSTQPPTHAGDPVHLPPPPATC